MFEAYTKSVFINGTWHEVKESATETVYNPATLKPITQVSHAGAKEAEQAIAAALKAFPAWSKKTGRKRSQILYKAYQMMYEKC